MITNYSQQPQHQLPPINLSHQHQSSYQPTRLPTKLTAEQLSQHQPANLLTYHINKNPEQGLIRSITHLISILTYNIASAIDAPSIPTNLPIHSTYNISTNYRQCIHSQITNQNIRPLIRNISHQHQSSIPTTDQSQHQPIRL